MEKIKAFLDAVQSSPKTKELIRALPAPKNDAEAAEGYVSIAKELGFDLAADEILAGLKGMEQKHKAQSDKIALDPDDLDNVAGGAIPGCDETHFPGEWCWFSDSCSVIITYYDDPEPENHDAFNRMTFHDDNEVDDAFKEENWD